MRAVVLALLLAGCASNPGEIRVVERKAPPAPPAQRRFELVETATIETASRVELWFPLASTEEGVQEIERLDVTIRPDVTYEITSDWRGNRMLHLTSKGPVEATIAYRVLRTELDIGRVADDDRSLTEAERRLLAPELGPTGDSEVRSLREAGHPARRVAAISLPVAGSHVRRRQGIEPDSFVEVYSPVSGWGGRRIRAGSLYPQIFLDGLEADLLVVARGAGSAVPFAKVDGVETVPRLTWKVRDLDVP